MYTSQADIEDYLLIKIDPSFEPRVASWIKGVSRHIDRATNRTFGDSVEETRYFDGSGTATLLVDDLLSVEAVEIDGVEVEDYFLYPANRLPKTQLKLDGALFSRGRQNVKVTADWGYSDEVPEDIRFAATVFVAGIVNVGNTEDREVESESIGRFTVKYRTKKQMDDFRMAKETLSAYRKRRF